MAWAIKQENYLKKPTAEQRKVWTKAWRLPLAEIPATRIDTHLKIRELLADPNTGATRKRLLKEWQAKRKEARARRKLERENSDA